MLALDVTSPSPFIPGTQLQFAWDSTSLSWLKTCPRLYQYSMLEGWRAKRDSVHLRWGQLYHKALEDFDRLRVQGSTHDVALESIVWATLKATWEPEGRPWATDHPTKTRENLIRSIIWYTEAFVGDPAQTVILANGKPAVELSFKMELEWPANGHLGTQPYLLCGHIDRLVTFTGGQYVMDRKTTGSAIGTSYFDQYDPDNQMSLYSLAAQVIYKTPVRGVIIDAVQVLAGGSVFARGFTYRTSAQLGEWLADLRTWLYLAEGFARGGHWPMNDRSCHHYGGCVFRGVCSKSPEVRHRFLASDFRREPWNPLTPR